MYDSDLFFVCSLIECLGRQLKLGRREVVEQLGAPNLARLYRNASILHCEPIEKVADDCIQAFGLTGGDYDNVAACRYAVPSVWDIGEVYQRLVEDVRDGDTVAAIVEVFGSWISDALSNFNTDFYYQSRGYIYQCYLAGEALE